MIKPMIALMMLCISLYAEQFTVDANTVALYHFNEGSGSIAVDMSDSGFAATLSGPTWDAKGMFGSCLYFDGSDYATMSENVSRSTDNPGDAGSIEMWVKTVDFAADYVMFSNCKMDFYSWWFEVQIYSDSTFGIHFNRGNCDAGFIAKTQKKFDFTRRWYYVAATFDNNGLKLYVDGNDEPFNITCGADTLWLSAASITDNFIGKRDGSQGVIKWYKGYLDEFRFSKTARSSSEISSHWETNKERATLVVHWDFNDGSGSTLTDKSIYGNDGTINGPVWNTGIEGHALSFDGVNDYINCGSDASLQIANSFTISVWVKPFEIGAYDRIVSNYASGSGRYQMALDSNSGINFGTRTYQDGIKTWNAIRTFNVVSINVWNHIVGTYDKDSGNMRLYINGDLKDSLVVGSKNLYPCTTWVGIGQDMAIDSDNWFKGTIDEISMYNKALNLAEIQNLYAQFSSPLVLVQISSPTLDRLPWFQWHPVDSATTYTIQMDTTPLFEAPLTSIATNDTFFRPLTNLPIDTIYWHVKSDLSSVYSATGSFVIQDPSIPILIAYTPDPTQNRRPTLQWRSVSGAMDYHIMVDNDRTFSSAEVSISVGDTFFTPLTNLPFGMNYWKVKSDLNANYSGLDSFYILPDTIPYLYAFNGDSIIERRPVFAWKPVTRATLYRIQIDTSRIFNAPMTSIDVSDTAFTPLSDLNYRIYYWRVSCDLNLAAYGPIDSVAICLSTKVGQLDKEQPYALTVSPNPFNPSTVLSFYNPGRNADVRIYSIDGSMTYSNSSVHGNRLTWDASGYPSGVYVVKVSVGGRILSRKVCLMK